MQKRAVRFENMWVFHKQRSITYIIFHLIDEMLSVTEIETQRIFFRFAVEVCEKRRKRLNKLKESIAKIENDPNDPKSKRRLTILLR